MSNCCLKYTDWLSDIILIKGQIQFTPDLASVIQAFNPVHSGIWQPLICNNIRYNSSDSDFLLPYNVHANGSGVQEHVSKLLGYNKFVRINSPQFKNWTTIGNSISPHVDIGMSYENTTYYLYKNNRSGIAPSIQSKSKGQFSIQTINVIRNKLNDEKKGDENLLSLTGNIPRIDPDSSITRTEVIPRGKTGGLEATNSELIDMFTAVLGDGIEWTFNGNLEKFKYLSTSDSLILDYTVFTQKFLPGETLPRTGQYSVRVLLFGQNDLQPPVVMSETGNNQINLNNDRVAYAKGTLTVKDEDLSQQVYVSINGVTIGGSLEGSNLTVEDVKNMLVFNRNVLRNSTTKQQTIEWFFNGGSDSFSYLRTGSSIALIYDLYIYDNLGKYTNYTKTITIVGKNEAPAIGVYDISDSAGGTYDLNNPRALTGTLSIGDIDYNDSISASVIGVNINYSQHGAGNNPQQQFLSMLNASGSSGKINWTFSPNTSFLKYLSGGQVVRVDYTIKVTDGGGANGYGIVSILIIGKNEEVQTSLPDLDTVITLPPRSVSLQSTTSAKFETTFTISDNNLNDFVNASIIYCEYNHINVPEHDIPKNLDIKRMLYFIPQDPQGEKNISNSTGTYKLIFDSFPETFRYLDDSDKKAILYYEIIVCDSYGSYRIKKIKFTISGSEDAAQNINTKNINLKFADYIWGWYRWYDRGRLNDTRHIPGVDFYFGDIDTFLFYGEPEFFVPQSGGIYSLSALPSGYEYASGRLTVKNNINDIITLKNLDSFFPNSYEKSGILAILKTHPYIDLVTHNMTDPDAFGYTRDSYGRAYPLLSGLSIKEFNNIGNKKFVSKTEDIAYRLAEKYGLRMVVPESQHIRLRSKFVSCLGANLGVQQKNKIYQKKGINDFAFMDVGITIGDNGLKYNKQLAKYSDNTVSVIKLNLDTMSNSPLIDYGPCRTTGITDYVFDLPPENEYGSRYNTTNYYFNIIDFRLNNELFHQDYIINNTSGNYSYINTNIYNANIEIDFHGHGGIKQRCFDAALIPMADSLDPNQSVTTMGLDPWPSYSLDLVIDHPHPHYTGNIFFDPNYTIDYADTIEGDVKYIVLDYFSNINSQGEIGSINIEHLRSPNKPKCRPFIDEKSPAHTIPNSFRYDFRNRYYISQAYTPSISTYYIPSGYYYGNHYAADKAKIGIHFENHPDPRTPLTKTHDLKIINPTEKLDYTGGTLCNLSYNGSFSFKYNLQHLPAGRISLYCLAASGLFTLSLLPNNDTVSTSEQLVSIDTTLTLDFDPVLHDKARIEVSMEQDCDNWTIILSHETNDYLKLPLISKLQTYTQMGFFHPNKGWLSPQTHPQYVYKSPMVPYAPSPLESKQTKLEENDTIRNDYYFWYDAEKMYTDQYLDGYNFIVDTSGMSKPLIDLIDRSKYIAFPQNNGEFYYITPDFYKFKYTEEESPIKESIKLSYIDIDASNFYPFNDFTFGLVDPRIRNKIFVNSNSDIKRCLAYFDEPRLRSSQEAIKLISYEGFNSDNQIQSITQTINSIQRLIVIAQERIGYFTQQIGIISSDMTISQESKNRSIVALNQIITNLGIYINSLNNNIALLNQRIVEIRTNASPFIANIVGSSGNNESLILTISPSLPQHLWNGGFIFKDGPSNRHTSVLLYRSNVTRNDAEIKIGKWGNIIAGKDVSEYNNSVLRQKKWNQSSLFLNYGTNSNIIISSGYYFPYSYSNNEYNINGNKIYSVLPNKYNEEYNFEDCGLISVISNRINSYIYAGPYNGAVLISRVPKKQLIQLSTQHGSLLCSIPPSGISDYGVHNLRASDLIKIHKTSSKQISSPCFNFNYPYAINSDSLTKTKAYIGFPGGSKVPCSQDPDPFTSGNIAILETLNPNFHIANLCLGEALIKYNNVPVANVHYKPKTPIFYELDYRYDNLWPYATFLSTYHNMSNSGLRYEHLHLFDKFLGNDEGYFFTYVNDPIAQDRDGLIRTNRYAIYNHNDTINIKEYSNIVGDDSPLETIKNPMSPAGLTSLLPEQKSNNDAIDNVINSLRLQINNLNNTVNILNYNLSDTSVSAIDKNKYQQNIQQISQQIGVLSTNIGVLNGLKTSLPPTTYTNFDKIPRHTSINFPENKYKSKNPFIDMNIFSEDNRFKPNLVNGIPSVSGYVYFEGLVEPRQSKFYTTMETPYNPYKVWIDIPKGAKWGVMHKNGKVFWQNTVYSVQRTFEVSCDGYAVICDDRNSPEDRRICEGASVSLTSSADELLSILKLPNPIFENQIVSLPANCGNLDFCCYDINDLDSSSLEAPYLYNKTTDCITEQTTRYTNCTKSFYPQNTGLYFDIICHHDCPAETGIFNHPTGTLGGYQYGEGVLPTASGKAMINGQSFIMFRIKNTNFNPKTFLTPSTSQITFIDAENSLNNSHARVDNTIFNHYKSIANGAANVPFSGVGYIIGTSGQQNGVWTDRYCSYVDLIEPLMGQDPTYYFKDINLIGSNFLALNANHSGLIWKNEKLYRDFVPHSGCFSGFMGEYDVECNLNNNPFYKANLSIAATLPRLLTKKAPEIKNPIQQDLCKALKDLKQDAISPGPLYKTIIIDGNREYTVEVSLERAANDRFQTKYVLNLGENDHNIIIEHTGNSFDYLAIYKSSNCPTYDPKSTEKISLSENCYFSEKILSITNFKLPFITCLENPCPEEFFYCDDVNVQWNELYGETASPYILPKCVINYSKNKQIKIVPKTRKLGKSKQSCLDVQNGVVDSNYTRSYHPKNYYYALYNYESYLCWPEPDYEAVKYTYENFDNYISFQLNVYHNILEIILPDIGGASWPERTNNKNRFYVARESDPSLFPIVKTYVQNNNISINGLYRVINNSHNHLGEVILNDQ